MGIQVHFDSNAYVPSPVNYDQVHYVSYFYDTGFENKLLPIANDDNLSDEDGEFTVYLLMVYRASPYES